ncbi:cysteine--tRNA ligase [candidate division CSSED10-310 bacterium]|uniref:Cysteine--tRNA ligase n=1 Tax=candidate division CSSED10-310 bacterium TaxID=2855610 RepID=A0ABV6YX70_UNCC1
MLNLFNTMTRTVAEFRPIDEKMVSLYTCGPTVYNYAHIGNLRTYIFEDILKRTLFFSGYQVHHVMNVTDVGHLVSDADTGEDKMEVSAQSQGKQIGEIADFFFRAFQLNLADLNILEPDLWCKATDHIPEQIEFIEKLEKKGLTYIIEDGVYFDTSKFPDYGHLARKDKDGLKAGARIDLVAGKRLTTDFALWKFSPKGKQRLMEWDSPWGTGFPGWHIECSAMAMKYLGARIDIHCGGIDHISIHHTNEIAQVESITGNRWVNWWMHGEFLILGRAGAPDFERMSKSSGNFITLEVVKKQGIEPLAFRYFCLNAHYRSPLTFTWQALTAASRSFAKLKMRMLELKENHPEVAAASEAYLGVFQEAVMDDLNMPRALAALWEMLKDTTITPSCKLATLTVMDSILGLNLEMVQKQEILLSEDIQILIQKREQARKEKNYQQADQIRNELLLKGIILQDTTQGTRILLQ